MWTIPIDDMLHPASVKTSWTKICADQYVILTILEQTKWLYSFLFVDIFGEPYTIESIIVQKTKQPIHCNCTIRKYDDRVSFGATLKQ